MIDDDLRTLFRERAGDVDGPVGMPGQLRRRVRRRRLLMALAAAGTSVALVAGGVVSVGLLTQAEPPSPIDEVTPPPPPAPVAEWRGIWPETTREEGEQAQRAADEGILRWRVFADKTIREFTRTELGWQRAFYSESLDIVEDESGPLDVHISTCDMRSGDACLKAENSERAAITIERLIRRDATGIWFVTDVEGPSKLRVAAPPPADGKLSPSAPGTFVGVVFEGPEPIGRIDLVNSQTGDVVRTIVDQVDLSEGLGDLILSSSGEALFYTQGTSACTSEIHRVTVAGGTPELVVEDGSTPALSHDGEQLAYVAGATLGCGGQGQRLVVRDLRTGSETRWDLGHDTAAGSYSICRLAWLPDSRRLAFNLCTQERETLHLLNVQADEGMALKDARRLGPQDDSLSLVGFHTATGGIAVRAYCGGYLECPDPWRLLSVDPDTGEVVAELLQLPDGIYVMAVDASGTDFIYVSSGMVTAWSGEGHPAQIAQGYHQVVW